MGMTQNHWVSLTDFSFLKRICHITSKNSLPIERWIFMLGYLFIYIPENISWLIPVFSQLGILSLQMQKYTDFSLAPYEVS